jgi:outer membrane protein TolC
MKKKLLLIILFVSMGMINYGRAEENTTLSLPSLIDEALSKNPMLSTKDNQVKALGERIPPAGTLPDPKLKLGLANLPEEFDFNESPMSQKQIALSQKLPFPGKLRLKKEMARDEYNLSRAEFDYNQLELINRVKTTYYSLFFIEKSIGITEKNKTVLENFLEIARTRYTVGKGIQQDVMKAEVELSRMIEKLVMLKQQKTTATAQLNTLLGREPATPLEGSPEVSKTTFSLNPEKIRNASLEDHPLLRSVESLQGKAESAHSLARREYYPDFEVTFAYAQREDSFHQDRPDFFSGFVGINLPIWHKTKLSRKVEETRYTILSAEKRCEDTRNNLQFRISNILAEIDQNDHLINLYQDGIVPQATHTLNSSLASYQVGTVDFLTLLTNLLTLFRYELEYYRVLTDYEKNLANLELAMGKRLF